MRRQARASRPFRDGRRVPRPHLACAAVAGAAAGKIYFASETGKLSVVAPGAAWEVIAVNDLNEEIYATPALSDGKIFVRARGGLYCFGK